MPGSPRGQSSPRRRTSPNFQLTISVISSARSRDSTDARIDSLLSLSTALDSFAEAGRYVQIFLNFPRDQISRRFIVHSYRALACNDNDCLTHSLVRVVEHCATSSSGNFSLSYEAPLPSSVPRPPTHSTLRLSSRTRTESLGRNETERLVATESISDSFLLFNNLPTSQKSSSELLKPLQLYPQLDPLPNRFTADARFVPSFSVIVQQLDGRMARSLLQVIQRYGQGEVLDWPYQQVDQRSERTKGKC